MESKQYALEDSEAANWVSISNRLLIYRALIATCANPEEFLQPLIAAQLELDTLRQSFFDKYRAGAIWEGAFYSRVDFERCNAEIDIIRYPLAGYPYILYVY